MDNLILAYIAQRMADMGFCTYSFEPFVVVLSDCQKELKIEGTNEYYYLLSKDLASGTEIAPTGYYLPRGSAVVGVRCNGYQQPFRKAALGWAAVRLCGAEQRSCRGRARSALRHHAHRGCLSRESEANVASSAMRP